MSLVKIIKNMVFNDSIGNEKNTEMHTFNPHVPEIKYVQNDENNCVLSSMDYGLFAVNDHVEEHADVSQISSSLSCGTVGFINRTKFSSDILTYCAIKKGEKQCRYKLVQWNNKGSFDIFNDISDHVIFDFQLVIPITLLV